MVDTAEKTGHGLTSLLSAGAIAGFVDLCHSRGLSAAIAGAIGVRDLGVVRGSGADVVGVRGAVCEGARDGSNLSREKVAAFRASMIAQQDPGR